MLTLADMDAASAAGASAASAGDTPTSCPHAAQATPAERALARAWVRGFLDERPAAADAVDHDDEPAVERRHRLDYVRDDHGQFAHVPGAGLPDLIAGTDVQLGSATARIEALSGDRVRLNVDGAGVVLNRASAIKAAEALFDALGTKTFNDSDGHPGLRVSYERDEHTDKPTASLTLLHDDRTLPLTPREVARFRDALEGVAASRRVELVSGKVDMFVADGKVGIRTQVGDHEPVALEFDKKSWLRLRDAHNVVHEGYDEDGAFGPAEADVDELVVKTNAGLIRISRDPSGDPDSPDLTLTAVDRPGWSLTHGAHYDDPFFQTRLNIDEAMGLEV